MEKQQLAQAKSEEDQEEKIQDLSLKQIEIKKEELNILKTSENVTLSQQISEQEKIAEAAQQKSSESETRLSKLEALEKELKSNLSERKDALETQTKAMKASTL